MLFVDARKLEIRHPGRVHEDLWFVQCGDPAGAFNVKLGENLAILIETPFGAFNVELGENLAVLSWSSARTW